MRISEGVATSFLTCSVLQLHHLESSTGFSHDARWGPGAGDSIVQLSRRQIFAASTTTGSQGCNAPEQIFKCQKAPGTCHALMATVGVRPLSFWQSTTFYH